MPANNDAKGSTTKNEEYQALVRKIADRVWELWRKDMRQSQERQGQVRRR
jgi:hypothetical protein